MTSSLVTLIVATAVLVMIPGPNVALIVANSLKYGFRMGVATVLGTTVGVGLQLLLVVFGLAAVVAVAADALTWIRWVGVTYLVYLGIRTWREQPDDLAKIEAAPATAVDAFDLLEVAAPPEHVGGERKPHTRSSARPGDDLRPDVADARRNDHSDEPLRHWV